MSKITNKEVNYFLHLISCTLNGKTPRSEDGIRWTSVLSLAKMHQVYNIIYPIVIELSDASDAEKEDLKNHTMSELKRMIVIGNERNHIFSLLEENGIKYMPLKGLIIKKYYPKESMRQMSDNDLLFDVSKRDVVAEIMKNCGYKPTATGENSDDYFKPPYSTFEFHRSLFFEENDFCPRFDNVWDNAVPDSEHQYLYHMALDDVYIYNVCHMYKHFSTAGCGVRFLIDNYLFLKKENENLNWDYIRAQLAQYGISDFEKKSRVLAFKIFDEEPLSNEETALLETFINFGLFGSGDIRLAKSIHSLAENGEINKAKRKYVLSRLFPSKKKMIADYRVLEKHPYLLPFYYFYRLFKGAAHSEKTINEIKSVKKFDKE